MRKDGWPNPLSAEKKRFCVDNNFFILLDMTPNTAVYNALVTKAFAKGGKANEALEVMQEMKRVNISPDVITYATAMEAFAKVAKQLNVDVVG